MNPSTKKGKRKGKKKRTSVYNPYSVIGNLLQIPSRDVELQSILHQDSPNIVQVKGMGVNVKYSECFKFFRSFGPLKKIHLRILGTKGVVGVEFLRLQDAYSLRGITHPILYKGNRLEFIQGPAPTDNRVVGPVDKSPLAGANKGKKGTGKKRRKFLQMSAPEAYNLDLRGSFKDQLGGLIDCIRLHVEDIPKMAAVCQDIQDTLKHVFPYCQVLPFGSVTHGLAFVDSDIDCYCNVDSAVEYEERDKQIQLQILKKARTAFYRNSYMFKNIQFIASAKVPIIKFKHALANVDVDINFKNSFGVLNSELIRHLVNSDTRILPLCIFLKYWAKSLSFIGVGKFTSYSLTLMIIYYLQRLSHPILPPIVDLQKDNSHFMGHWNVGFSRQDIPSNNNFQSVLTLIHNFFDFYSSFEYDTSVICPLVGLAMPFESFQQLNLPIPYNHFIDMVRNQQVQNFSARTAIMVQDPFELNRNCSHQVNNDLLEQFIFECRASSEIIKKSISENNQNNLIVKLTSLCKFLPSVCQNFISFYLPISTSQTQSKVEKSRRITWANEVNCEVRGIVENILLYVAKCEFDFKSSYQNPNSACSPRNTFECKILYNMWFNRDMYRHSDGLLTTKEEATVSSEMFNVLYGDIKPLNPLLTLTLDICVDSVDGYYDIDFKTSQKSDAFFKFVEFIVPFIEWDLRQHYHPLEM